MTSGPSTSAIPASSPSGMLQGTRGNTMSLRNKLAAGKPVFGVTLYSGSCMGVELLGHWGFDYVFLDTEHASVAVESGLEKLVMSARLVGVTSVVRLSGAVPAEITKTLDYGADGVVIPQVRDAIEMRAAVAAAKYPPQGRRGGDVSVRAANFGGRGFNWTEYAARANRDTLVVPIAENLEFFENIDEILSVPGVDIVAFGPNDYALARGLPIGEAHTDAEMEIALDRLIERAHAHNVAVMTPCIPTTKDRADILMTRGVDCLTTGNDTFFLNQALSRIAEALFWESS